MALARERRNHDWNRSTTGSKNSPKKTANVNAIRATTLQNTNRSTVTVYSRFHAYAGQELEVIHYPVRRCEWVIVRTPRGTSLKIPQWMVQPSASEIVISPHAILSTNCLARLMELVPGPDLKEPSATVPETRAGGTECNSFNSISPARRT